MASVIGAMDAVAVASGAAVGALLRYGVSEGAVRAGGVTVKPWATCTVNIVGSGALGAVVALSQPPPVHRSAGSADVLRRAASTGTSRAAGAALSPRAALFFSTGLLGGFTTFSSFAVDVALAGSFARGAALVAITNAGSLGAAVACFRLVGARRGLL